MRNRKALLTVAVAGIVLLVGCGTETIPRAAVAGTTIAVGIPFSYRTGFGRALTGGLPRTAFTTALPTPPYPTYPEDEARGEFVFSLYTNLGNFVTYLPLRYVTRIRVDENAPAALDVDEGFRGGQTVAFVDLPPNIPTHYYSIQVEHYRRSATPPHDFVREQRQLEGGDWVGWGQRALGNPWPNPHVGIGLIKIINGTTARHNDFTGWIGSGGALVSEDETDSAGMLLPDPAIRIYLHDPFSSEPKPAAIQFVLEYRRSVIDIVGVQLVRAQQSSALAFLTPDQTTPTSCAEPDVFGAVPITILDPEAGTGIVEITYRLRNFADPGPGCGRLEPNGLDPDVRLQVGSVRSYDPNGVEFGPTTVWFEGLDY